MSSSLPKITVPNLTPDEMEGLKDYWTVYEAHMGGKRRRKGSHFLFHSVMEKKWIVK